MHKRLLTKGINSIAGAKKPGIYKILNKTTGRVYIGKSIDLVSRLGSHKYRLRHNKAHNRKMQEDWNKYGEGDFEFSIILFCEPAQCLQYEQKLFDIIKPHVHGYNVQSIAGSHGNAVAFIERNGENGLRPLDSLPNKKTAGGCIIYSNPRRKMINGQIADRPVEIKMGGCRFSLSRFAFSDKYGPIAPSHSIMSCRHSKWCYNPEHLTRIDRSQTSQYNYDNGYTKKVYGKNHHRTKVSDDDVRYIRESDDGVKELTKRFGISSTYFYMLRNGERRPFDD